MTNLTADHLVALFVFFGAVLGVGIAILCILYYVLRELIEIKKLVHKLRFNY